MACRSGDRASPPAPPRAAGRASAGTSAPKPQHLRRFSLRQLARSCRSSKPLETHLPHPFLKREQITRYKNRTGRESATQQSSKNDSAATPERDTPNRSAVVRSPAPAIRSPRTRGPCPTYISRPWMLRATLARLLGRGGRRRIILTASAPQNGKALPHDADPTRAGSLPRFAI
jgi:hypothetical protein